MTRPLVLLALGLGLGLGLAAAPASAGNGGLTAGGPPHRQSSSIKAVASPAKKSVKAKQKHTRVKAGGWNRVKNHP